MKRLLLIILPVIVVATLGFGAYLYVTKNQPTQPSPSPTPSPTSSQSASSTPTPSPSNTSYPVLVYFSKRPESDNDPGKTFAVNRISPTLGVGTYAISQLLKGPSSSETNQGYFTTAVLRTGTSSCGGSDFKLTIANGVATLQFCKQFDHRGVVADGQADSEIKATLRQFNTVQKVIILNPASNCEFDLSGMNLCKQ